MYCPTLENYILKPNNCEPHKSNFLKNPLTTTLIIGALGLQVYTVTILTLRVLSTNHGADLWENIDDFALGASQAIDLMKIS